VPLDQDSTLYTVDADLRQELGLFPEVTGFRSASLFRTSEGGFELVIQYREGGQTLRRRRSLSADEVERLRRRVSRRSAARAAPPLLNQEGRYGLLAATTPLGITEGALLAAALGAEEQSAAALPLMGGAAGFFVPLLATQDRSVTEAEADMTFYGGVQGYVHAVQLVGLFGSDEGEGTAGLAAVLGASESVIGYAIARGNRWSGGHAEMVSFTGLAGNLIGLGLAGGSSGTDPSARLLAGSSLAGSLVGGYVGHRLGRTDRYTQGDARVYLQTGTLTTNLVVSVLAAGEAPDSRGTALTTSGAAIGGLVLGRALVQNRDFSKSQSNLILLGTSAGALLGGGTAAWTDGEGGTVAVLQALGATAGFGVTYSLFDGSARRAAQSTSARVDWGIDVTPKMSRPGPLPGSEQNRRFSILRPEITLRASF